MVKTLFLYGLLIFSSSLFVFANNKTEFGPVFPDKPVLLSVSVDTSSGKAVLSWIESTELNITKYFIFLGKSYSEFILIDSVYNLPLDNYYIDISNGDPSVKSCPYIIQSFNDVGSGNSSEFSEKVSTLYATVVFDSCNAKNTLNWNTRYKLWHAGNTDNYFILRSIEGSSYSQIATVSGNESSYIDLNVQPNQNYSYIIQANKENDTLISFSNKVNTYTDMAVLPNYINANSTTVVDENSLSISFSIDPISEISKYKLLRSSSISGIFDTIYEYNSYPQHILTYTDNDINTNKEIYYYKLIAINYCNVITTESNIASNIVLDASEENYIVSLNWNKYENWNGDISSHTIHRLTISDSIIIDGTENNYTDKLNADEIIYKEYPSHFCYYISTYEVSNPYGISGISTSNVICINTDPFDIKIGNALNPNSTFAEENRTFKPYFTFLPKKYQFLIYDRWGKKVFETDDPTVGWDGTTLSGNNADEGVYIYKLKMTSFDDVTIRRTDHVTLVYQ